MEDQILVFGYYLQKKEKFQNFQHNDIENCFSLVDFQQPTNINSRLRGLKNKQMLVENNGGYRVERTKTKTIEIDILGKPKLKAISSNLESLPKLLKEPEKQYVAEAVGCLKIDAYHAALILMWTITLSHLRNYVLAYKLNEFNIALSNNPKYVKKNLIIIKYDDFEDIGDFDFLSLLRDSGIVSKNQFKLLNEKLGIRNTYAHPVTLTLTDSKTISFIEDLINDIITKIK